MEYNNILNKWTKQWFQFILDNPEEEWDYIELSTNPNTTLRIIKNNSDLPWDYSWLSCNCNVTWEFIQKNPDKPWDYNHVSEKSKYYVGNY
jgi:hypothetical protein